MKKFSVESGYLLKNGVSLYLKELIMRLHWFTQLRWLWIVVCLVGSIATMFSLIPAKVNSHYLIGSAIFLAITNIIYTHWTKLVISDVIDIKKIRVVIISQVHTDYMVLALVTYAFGGIETPVLALFLAEIGLVSLFCNRYVSFSLTLTGAIFATLPMLLEYLGVIPILSIYNGSYKSVIASNPQFVMNYLIGVPVFFLFCWYFVSEITKSLRLREYQLEDAYKKLTLINREKSQSTLRAAHELKAPLAAIKSFIYTMRDGYCGELPKQAQKVILRIGERADLLMEKVVDIIHLSNLRTLVLPEIEMTNIDLNKMLEKEIDEAQILANSHDITIEHNLEQQPSFEIFGSEKYLHTAISNILQNAINYSYEKSTINIELLHKNEQLIIVIRDHGIGIARENLTKIFDEHFRTNNAVAHNPNGTGLGLPMVKEIIKFHHAHINVDSELKKGTTFTLKFPLQNIKKAPDKQK